MAKKTEKTFEEKLRRLEIIVELLDKGEEPLDELIKLYEEGMQLATNCREFLEKAELKVIEISKSNKTGEIKEKEENNLYDNE
jgi:exodeoxyribonuclease VII small subunit